MDARRACWSGRRLRVLRRSAGLVAQYRAFIYELAQLQYRAHMILPAFETRSEWGARRLGR